MDEVSELRMNYFITFEVVGEVRDTVIDEIAGKILEALQNHQICSDSLIGCLNSYFKTVSKICE